MTRKELLGKIDVLLGGRTAELLTFGDVSTGAHNDLQRATDLARAMVAEYGMGRTLGLATYQRPNRPVFLQPDQAFQTGKEYSEATAADLDKEIRDMLADREGTVKELLSDHIEVLNKIAKRLLETEVMEREEFDSLLASSKDQNNNKSN